MNREVDITTLEKYLEGEIGAHEVLDVNGNPVSKIELERVIEDFEDLKLSIEATGLVEEFKKLREKKASTKRVLIPFRILKIAAGVLLIGVSAYLIWSQTQEPKLSTYFGHFDDLITVRNDTVPIYSEALATYSSRNYETAVQLFEEILSNESNDDILFYAGVSAIGSQQFEKAINFFDAIEQEGINKYGQQLNWYRALAYWQLGNISEAIFELEKIDVEEFEYNRAQSLLIALQKSKE